MLKKRRIESILSVIVALSIILSNLLVLPVQAANVKLGSATRDDTYKYLEEAAKINVVVNNLKKCLKGGSYLASNGSTGSPAYGGKAKKGAIFTGTLGSRTTYTSTRWLESEMGAGDDGQVWCHEGQDDGNGILQIYKKMVNQSYAEILCAGGRGGILRRAHSNYSGYNMTVQTIVFNDEDKDCSSFDDSGAMYALNTTWESHLKSSYLKYKSSSGNKYLPDWGTIGSFNNVDGMFNYMLDFNKVCSADVYDSDPGSSTTTKAIVYYEKDNTKIVAKKKYYHVKENKTWTGSLSSDHATNSCDKLLNRIAELAIKYNEVTDSGSGDSREKGYGAIILKKLEEACSHMQTDGSAEVACPSGMPSADCERMQNNPSTNAYLDLLPKLQEIVDSDDASDENKQKAQESIDKINAAKNSGNYVEISGSVDEPDGKVYQCLDIAQLSVAVNDYSYAGEELGEGSDSENEPSCFDKAGSLGWIICPITNGISDVIQDIYESFIVPFLKIDVGLFTGTGSSGSNNVFSSWQVFQTLANIVFALLFLVVIFSQLTGVGIDNYGIKKTLPKLIVSAALINLSYIICEVAIDLANISGVGIQGIFNNIQEQVGLSSVSVEGQSGASTALATGAGVVLVAGIAAAVTVPAVLAQGLGIIIPVLMALLSALLAIIFLFAILAIRQALAVILVVVSPLAFVCYMLPNTKKTFDKWFNTFKGLLLAYPICSAMIYGGQAVGAILISANSTGGSGSTSLGVLLSAAIMSIAPIFLIPGTIKKSMGAITGMIAGVSNKLSGRLTNAAQRGLDNSALGRRRAFNMQQYDKKKFQKMGEYNAKRARATMNALDKKVRNGRALTNKERARYKTAAGMVGAENARMVEESQAIFSTLGDEGILKHVESNMGNMTSNDFIAAVGSIKDENKVIDLYNKFAESKGFSDMVASDSNRIAGALASRQGNVVAQSMGKLIGSGAVSSAEDLKFNRSNDADSSWQKLRTKVQGAGTDIVSSQSKDVFKIEGMNELLSQEQLAAGVGAGLTGSKGDEFAEMVGRMSEEDRGDIAAKMSAEQVSNMSSSGLRAIGGNNVDTKAAEAAGATLMKSKASSAINTLNSNDGAQLRTKIDPTIATALGVSAPDPQAQSQTQQQASDHTRLTEQGYRDVIKAHPRQSGESTQHWADRIYTETGIKVGKDTHKF